ncbi:MAG: hypothetical protein WDM92_06950 [Caulobacteraceae bacterium]
MFGSLDSYEKGSIEVNDDLKHYAFSNVFEVAGKSAPFERVAVAKNIEYVAEVTKVDGAGPLVRGAARRVRHRHGRRGGVQLRQARPGPGPRRRPGRQTAQRGAERRADGQGPRAARPPGAAAGRRGLPAQRGAAVGRHHPDPARPGDGRALGRDLHPVLTAEPGSPPWPPPPRTPRSSPPRPTGTAIATSPSTPGVSAATNTSSTSPGPRQAHHGGGPLPARHGARHRMGLLLRLDLLRRRVRHHQPLRHCGHLCRRL